MREDEIQDKYPVKPVGGRSEVTESEAEPGEPLFGPQGFGVKNGKPYGAQLQNERRDMASRFKFFPGQRRAFAAATRRALGR